MKTITGLTSGTTYYFRVSALDSARLESSKSFAASAIPMNQISWTQINNGLTNSYVQSLAINSLGYIFAGMYGAGVYRSTDNGENWTQVGLTSSEVYSFAINSSGYIFAGVGYYNLGAYLSKDNGTSWTPIGLTSSNVAALAINSSGTVFSGTYGGIYLSTNNGTTWTTVNNGLPSSPNILSLAINSSGAIFAGMGYLSANQGVYLSTDNGTSWKSSGLMNTGNIHSLIFNSSGYIFAGTDSGAYRSTNNGTIWTRSGLPGIQIMSFAANSSGTIFAGTYGNGVYMSMDNGASWTQINTGLTNTYVEPLAINSSGYIFAGTWGGGMYRTNYTNVVTASPPTISSFSPTSGPIGTTVTITGTNFSTTAANNIVYFGAVKAVVTMASTTSLSVAVPIGATYQPITVTANGLTAYASKPFIVTFAGGGSITSTSFASKVDFTTGIQPYNIAISDVDGDGKPDLAATNEYSHTVSIFRNTSTSGSVTASSFAPKVDFATGSYGIAISDVDGDGKPDLVVTGGNTVSVFRNTSTSGAVTAGSFAPKVDFLTGSSSASSMCVAICDVDGDGKPDLVVANDANDTVSVFRNTSTTGTITANSFASKVDFAAGWAHSIAVGDVDGDGKPDIVVANANANTISVLKNTSTSGSITASSFAPKVVFTA